MIGPGALSQTRVRRVTVTLGAVGSAGFKTKCKHREETHIYSVFVCVCAHVCVYAFQVGEREYKKKDDISLAEEDIEMEWQVHHASSQGLINYGDVIFCFRHL